MGTSEISASIAAVARSAQLTTAGAADTQTAAKSLVDMAAHLTKIARESSSI
jgi:methyl-accepting chemotaxis protein